MKNITVFLILVIMVSTANAIYAQTSSHERNYTFSIAPDLGFAYGQVKELLYQLPNYTMGNLLSELKWNMKPVFYLGLNLDFQRTDLMKAPGFFACISFKAGIPGDSGIHENRDWFAIGKGELTHFSSHTNKTREFYVLDAAIGASFPVKQYFYIKPFISGSWMRFAFAGRDGYGEYPYLDPAYHYVDYTGQTVITYEQNWLILAMGVSIGTKVLYPVSFDLYFQISPLTICGATDEHLTRNITFKDFPRYGLFLEPKVRIIYTLDRYDFILEFAYRHIGEATGDSYTSLNNGRFFLGQNKAGASLSFADIGLKLRIRF